MAGEEKASFKFFEEDSPQTVLAAFNDFDAYVDSQGPYDGVITFSQAADLAATWIIYRQRQGKPSFRCAISLSGSSPAVDVDSLREGKVVLLPPEKTADIINIPMAHVWGAADAAFSVAARDLRRLCAEETRSVFVHDGGHEVPGSAQKDELNMTVNTIRRAIVLAQEGY